MPGSHEVSRRDFVTVITATIGTLIGAVVGLPAIGYLLSPALKVQKSEARVALGPLENYPEDTPTQFNFTRTKINGWEKTINSYGVYVLRRGEEVRVFSNICTHLSCRVTWQEEIQRYHCPCHDADFAKDGEIIRGPQPRPLDEYEVVVEEGSVFINFTGG
jgi:menaquinol-cytochrome c reductase iron-sulfur subunit